MRGVREVARLDLSAASGLVGHGGLLYVVADDQLWLSVHRGEDGASLRRVPLFPGELPADPPARKKAKPDLEALALLPGAGGAARLLVLGSGSTPRRCGGAVVDLTPEGDVAAVTPLDLSALYGPLRARFAELNIEGAAVVGGRLWLLQRGNGPARDNAVIGVELEALLSGRRDGLLDAVRGVALGDLGGVALGFTDGAPLPDGRLLFSAAAEQSPDTYHDGACAGSVLGVLDPEAGTVDWMERLETDEPLKIEGVHAAPGSDGVLVYLVADADDPAVRAPLLTWQAGHAWPRGGSPSW